MTPVVKITHPGLNPMVARQLYGQHSIQIWPSSCDQQYVSDEMLVMDMK